MDTYGYKSLTMRGRGQSSPDVHMSSINTIERFSVYYIILADTSGPEFLNEANKRSVENRRYIDPVNWTNTDVLMQIYPYLASFSLLL